MHLDRGGLYRLLTGAFLLGYSWLFYNLAFNASSEDGFTGVCLIKNISDIPCPSCGSTRAIIALLSGHFSESLLINPLGLILSAMMILGPLWIFYDYSARKQTFYDAYKRMEEWMKKPQLYMPCIMLVLLNWYWNISKGL